MKARVKYLWAAFAGLLLVAIMFVSLPVSIAYAASPIGGEDGVYNVSYSIGGQSGIGADMLGKYLDNKVVVEKIGNKYYVSVTQLSSSMQNLSLNLESGKRVGYDVTRDSGGVKTYRYTLSEENISKALPFSVFVTARKETFTFTITLNLSGVTRMGDVADLVTERPAEFVPVITTSLGNEYSVKVGSVFAIPAATAVLGTEECTVTTSVYYLSNGEKQTVEITDNRFTVANVGEYHLVYKASSPSYKTSLGNDAYTEYDVKIISSVGGSTLAKFTDSKGVLPEGTAIMASRIVEGSSVYATAADKMKTFADNFEVFGVSFVSGDGNSVNLSENIELYLQANTTYDRTEIVVYYMDESGSLTVLNSSGYGRYVKVDTDKTGTFIVCIPGVAFVMPIWGYILIACGCGAIVLAAAITIPIVVVKHKRKKKKLSEEAE